MGVQHYRELEVWQLAMDLGFNSGASRCAPKKVFLTRHPPRTIHHAFQGT